MLRQAFLRKDITEPKVIKYFKAKQASTESKIMSFREILAY